MRTQQRACSAACALTPPRSCSGLPVVWDYVDHQKDGPSDGNTFVSFINSFAQFLPRGSTLVMVRQRAACCALGGFGS